MNSISDTAWTKASFDGAHATNMVVHHELNSERILIDIRRIWWAQPIEGRFEYRKNCLEFVLRSRAPFGRVIRDGALSIPDAGSITFIPKGLHFNAECDPNDIVKMCVAFDGHSVLNKGLLANEEPRARYDIHGRDAEAVLRRMAAEVRNPGFASDTLIEMLVGQLLVELSRTEVVTEDQSRRRALRLEDICDRIEEKLEDGIRVEDLAREFGTTSRTLLRLFQEQTGASITSYIADSRIQRAKRDLALGVPIKSVAFRCGFNSVSAFSAAFRRSTNVTPGGYRRHASTKMAAI